MKIESVIYDIIKQAASNNEQCPNNKEMSSKLHVPVYIIRGALSSLQNAGKISIKGATVKRIVEIEGMETAPHEFPEVPVVRMGKFGATPESGSRDLYLAIERYKSRLKAERNEFV